MILVIPKKTLLKELEELTKEYGNIDGVLLKKARFVKKLMGFEKKIGFLKLKTKIGEINITKHAIERMEQRGITKNMIIKSINNGENFKYMKNGKILKGYYDNSTKVFVGIGDNGVTTVINNVKINYINNLKNTLK